MSPERRKKLIDALVETVALNDILDDLLVAVADNCCPEEIFDDTVLAKWAEENDYKKEFVDPDVD